jgi:type VI secretion system secreted protein VgrG
MADHFSVSSHALPRTSRLIALHGTEALSTLYRFELHLLIEEPFDMAAALFADATVSINREDGVPFVFHGILSSIETVGDLARGALYHAVLVPRLFRLTLTHHSRVFVNDTTPQILESVLELGGLRPDDFALKLSAHYPKLDHVCQYRESYFAFLSRRLEREGMYYFFEQGEARERLVITDALTFHHPLSPEPVRFVNVGGTGAGSGNGFKTFKCKHSSIPGKVHVKDYDYLKPALPIIGHAPASGTEEEIHLQAENAVNPEDSLRIAQIRAEELKARQVVYNGGGRVFFMRPGYTFPFIDHPRFDGHYLVTDVVHKGSSLGGLGDAAALLGVEGDPKDDVYHVDVGAIPSTLQFRAERKTPVPRIYGLEKATVDGEADHHYAQLDDHGRYLVKIHFDESPLINGKASTRIRMMQPHAGNPESFHFPLRKHTEVLLSFDGGDPDRPLIAGVVPNLFKPTLVTGGNYTKNVLETGGKNRILIEDREDYQFVRISSPVHNSFIHLGAPNDSHNKIGFTGGNALSVTGYDSESNNGGNKLSVTGDIFYTQYLNPNIVASGITMTEHSADDTGGDPFILEARDVSAATFENNNPTIVTQGDLNMAPAHIVLDPDDRTSYKTNGSSLSYTRGDTVSKTEGDSLSALLGSSVGHTHGHNFSVIGNPPGGWGGQSAPQPGDPTTRTITWGDTYSEIHGDTEAHTYGNTFSEVTGHTTSITEGGSLSINFPLSISIQLSSLTFTGLSCSNTGISISNTGISIPHLGLEVKS